MSSQANIMLVLLIINTIINIIMSFVSFGLWGFLYMFLYLIFGGPIIVLMVYSINCLTSGGCNILSWFYTVMYILSIIIMLIWTIVLGIFAATKKDDEDIKKDDE